jgi:uncharacterized cupin superfamily protein
MQIKVEKPSAEEIADMQTCPTWSKEVSEFDWQYDATETCLLLEGEVEVTTPEGDAVVFGAGDLVTFPRGLRCTWHVRQPVRKHYRFG